MENTFQLGRMPYQVIGGQRFYERREIKDVIALLRLLVNPADNVAVSRVLNVPPRGIGKKSLEDLQADATEHGDSLLAAMRRTVAGEGAALRPAAIRSIGGFLEVVDRAVAAAETLPVEEVTERILTDISYEEYLEEEAKKQAYSRWENVTELLAAMQEFTDTPERDDASVTAFLQEVSLLTDTDDWDESAPRVTLMTLHNAKGLEFPWVFVTGAEEGLFPHANSMLDPGGLEEERRLFYVGVTRARERVAILHADSRRRWDGTSTTVPSRFLAEIDPEHVDQRSLGGAPAPRQPAVWVDRGAHRPVHRAAEDVPDFIPSYEDETQELAQIAPGMRVRHPSWGEGIVDQVEGAGERMKITIRFRGGILKKVLAIYAKLELLG
jgi:DNA helicase-2/ATP-dependent DNA helicase PcrA